MLNKVKLKLLFILYFTLFIIGAFLVFEIPFKGKVNGYDIGRILGFWALTTLSLQFVLSSRSKLLERGIGLDRIMKLHGFNAKFFLICAMLHPLFLGMFGSFKYYTLYHWAGFVALLFLIFTVITSIFSSKLKLNYEQWKIIHKVGYIILFLGFFHSFFIGSDMINSSLVQYWWLFLLALAITGITIRILRKTYEFKVESINKESHNVWSINIKPLRGLNFDYYPGQFAFVRFFGDISSEEHHFTISSSPSDIYLTFSIKESGDYTSDISKLKKGDRAILDGPYGVFTNRESDGPFLFISGGIGITPIMSMMTYMSKNKIHKDSVLIYIVKSSNDVVFGERIKKFSNEGWLKVFYRFTNKEGHIDEKFLSKISEIQKRQVYLVGPEAMMTSVRKLLINAEVNPSNIKTERFALK